MSFAVTEPNGGGERVFDSLPKAKRHMKAKAEKQMAFCRRFDHSGIELVGDLMADIEALTDASLDEGPIQVSRVVDTHSGVRMTFNVTARKGG